MSRQKQKGTGFETAVVRFLREELADERIERRTLGGSGDRGDVAGVTLPTGGRVVIECKAHERQEMARWLREAEAERQNDGALVGCVVSKRRGYGEARMGEQLVTMTLMDFAVALGAGRDEEED